MIWIVLTLVLSIILEANYISLPLTFASIVFWTVVTQRSEIFAVAFFAGLLSDALTFNFFGGTSAYLLLAILAIFLYRSKFEIQTVGFVGAFCFLGSIILMALKGSGNIFFGSLLTSIIMIISFRVYQVYSLKSENK